MKLHICVAEVGGGNPIAFGEERGRQDREFFEVALNDTLRLGHPSIQILDFSHIGAFDVGYANTAIVDLICGIEAQRWPDCYIVLFGDVCESANLAAALNMRGKAAPLYRNGSIMPLGRVARRERFAMTVLSQHEPLTANEFQSVVNKNTSFNLHHISLASSLLSNLHRRGLCWRYFDPPGGRGGGRQFRYGSLAQLAVHEKLSCLRREVIA